MSTTEAQTASPDTYATSSGKPSTTTMTAARLRGPRKNGFCGTAGGGRPRRRPSRRPCWERNSSTPLRLETQTNRLPQACFRPVSSPSRRSLRTV
jgi:hypothetical protein